jgi:hypothetical protein
VDCAAGTITVPRVGPQKVASYYGTLSALTTHYRTGGADDGPTTNAYSWEMVSSANSRELVNPLVGPEIKVWVPTGSRTVRLYLASAADKDNDEFWIDVHSPSEAGSATAQGRYQTTRCGLLSTPAALDRSASTDWTGANTGTDGSTGQQKIDVTINPTVEGWVTVIPHLAKASTTVYVDPELELTSLTSTYQRHAGNGVMLNSGNESGAADYPSEDDVRFGVDYDSGGQTGNMTLPAIADVEVGVQYGTNGTEFTGTLTAGLDSVLGAGDLDGGFA